MLQKTGDGFSDPIRFARLLKGVDIGGRRAVQVGDGKIIIIRVSETGPPIH
jgi:hypothetical protein